MSVSCADIFNMIEDFAPLNLAEEWDNPGLQIGNPELKVNRILLCLDVDEKVCDEAVRAGAQLIISHHPLLFKPVKQILTGTPAGALLAKCLCSGLVVYSAHTNLDNAKEGVNDELAKRLGLADTKVLRPGHTEKYLKLVVFVPLDHAGTECAGLSRLPEQAGLAITVNALFKRREPEHSGRWKAAILSSGKLGNWKRLMRYAWKQSCRPDAPKR